MDSEELFLRLGQLVAEMPELGGNGPITPAMNRWLGQAAELVRLTGDRGDHITLKVSSDGLSSVLRAANAQSIAAIVHRALARAETSAPAASRGAFVGIGAGHDALKAVRSVVGEAKSEVLFVDAYMDGKVLTDFAPLANEGVTIRLLTDSFSTKPDAVLPAAARWQGQYDTRRPLEVRMSAPRELHDRLIAIDGGAFIWSLTQSLKDFAGRSPALVQRVDPDLAKQKFGFYDQVWAKAARIA